MTNTITPTSPTFTQVVAPVAKAASTLTAPVTLDLTTKRGAWVIGRIGRTIATALTRSAYIAIRNTNNSGGNYPNTSRDLVSSTTAASVAATTLNGATSVGAATSVVTAGTFGIGDMVTQCLSATDATRFEIAKTANVSTTTSTWEQPLISAHSNGDLVVNAGDVLRVWVPGGDIYSIWCVNYSGQALIFAVDAIVDNGDTIT